MKSMVKKQLEWSVRSQVDRLNITTFYAQEASPLVADEAASTIVKAALAVQANPLAFRDGVRAGTREYVMRRFPFTLIYRVRADKVLIVRVMHQAAKYFN